MVGSATDPVEERRKQAEKHGAIALPEAELREAVQKATDGRGADAVMEVVGLPVALNLAIDLIRPWGVSVSFCQRFAMLIWGIGDILLWGVQSSFGLERYDIVRQEHQDAYVFHSFFIAQYMLMIRCRIRSSASKSTLPRSVRR